MKPDDAPPRKSKAPPSAEGDRASKDPMIGTVIGGRYRIEARLGEGGMGSVYRVEHTHMRKRLALKVLHREMTSQPEIVARFEREAMAAAHIEHPNVAGATDFGKLEDGSCYLVLEYVEGTSLRSLIEKGPVPPSRAVHITIQILAALKRAHELGIVHRDLKPENVLLVDKDGEPDFVKVLDFGIARVPIGAIGGEAGPSLTRAGMVYGTPEYMAPEQALGQDVDGRSDQYATGVILFEMLVGKRPYDNKDKVALLGQHVAGPIPSARSRAPSQDIPIELENVLTRMLAKSPSERYEDAAAAAEALAVAISGGSDLQLSSSGHFPLSGDAPSARSARELAPTEPPPALDADGTAPPVARVGSIPFSTRVLALLGAGAAVLLVLVVVIATRKPSDEGAGSRDAPQPTATADKVKSAQPPSGLSEASKQKVQSALGKVTAGEIESGIKELEAIAQDHPDDPVVVKALAQAYSKAKRHVDALSMVKKLVNAFPETRSDPAIEAIVDDALATQGAVDAAFHLLETAMKAEGARILYAIAYEGRGPGYLSSRAKKSLTEPDVQKAMSPALKGALEVRNAPFGCKERKEILEKYKSDFDQTALPVLKTWTRTTGCGGFFKRNDCWPCLREDNFLGKIIQGIEERTKK